MFFESYRRYFDMLPVLKAIRPKLSRKEKKKSNLRGCWQEFGAVIEAPQGFTEKRVEIKIPHYPCPFSLFRCPMSPPGQSLHHSVLTNQNPG